MTALMIYGFKLLASHCRILQAYANFSIPPDHRTAQTVRNSFSCGKL
ncbi:hypothetical protein CLV41_105269 [Roseibium marinum]|uniref:Uncharacterized protein n=1 Tax=Roseibium marinum TaxID=281252 RepID=A0A2S3UUF0_9HYPH|nr:hypothetical protein CLV41_105269 [Roseibium marinum]